MALARGLKQHERGNVQPSDVEPSCFDRARGGEFSCRGVVGIDARGAFGGLEGARRVPRRATGAGEFDGEGWI